MIESLSVILPCWLVVMSVELGVTWLIYNIAKDKHEDR